MKISPIVKKYLATIGSKGGKKSRRQLSPAQARNMVALREARKAYRDFALRCFWSYKPDATIRWENLPLVIEGLKNNGGRAGFERARKLQRLLAA